MRCNITDETKYYLCTFIVGGAELGDYKIDIIDTHPIDFMLSHSGYILINHIEMTQEHYDAYVIMYS